MAGASAHSTGSCLQAAGLQTGQLPQKLLRQIQAHDPKLWQILSVRDRALTDGHAAAKVPLMMLCYRRWRHLCGRRCSHPALSPGMS